MDLLILRSLHIIFGAFWLGGDILIVYMIVPRLRALGAEIEQPAMMAVVEVARQSMYVSATVIAISGVWMMGIARGWNLVWLTTTGYGWAMIIGIAVTVLKLMISLVVIPYFRKRRRKVASRLDGGAPTEAEKRALQNITMRIGDLTRANALLLIIVVITMVAARYV